MNVEGGGREKECEKGIQWLYIGNIQHDRLLVIPMIAGDHRLVGLTLPTCRKGLGLSPRLRIAFLKGAGTPTPKL